MVEKKSISELPSSTIKLITATQVATSVSNIVKELVENSLDAGSTVIRVKLENGGLTKIEVIDNGSGVGKEDVMKMALPHYTSKITQHQDIETLTTYGFRGEALAAVCAVAKLSVTTKTSEDPVAATYTMDNDGSVVDVKPSHLSQGTLIVITSLFCNVPVRKQYYQAPKRKKDEIVKVEDLLLNFGLIHPELHLSFHHDHSLVWQKSRASDFKANILQTLGHTICSHMEFINEESPIQMFLMVPKRTAPVDTCFRNRADRCFTFINQRPVISKDIEKLMKELYAFTQDSNQKSNVYPIFIVSLQFPGDEIDVNIEPNKSKVLMKRQGDVIDLIRTKVGPILEQEPISVHSTVHNSIESSPEEIAIGTLKENGRGKINETAVVEETVLEDSLLRISDENLLNRTNCVIPPETQAETFLDQNLMVDEDLFHGFSEPFSADLDRNHFRNDPSTSGHESAAIPIIDLDQWSRGLAKSSDGHTVNHVEVFRGQPCLTKRQSDVPSSGNTPKKPRLIEAYDASKIVGSSPSLLETVNGKVRKIPVDPFGEYCKEMRNELLSQDPLMSFTELTQNLSNGWKNLDKSSREKYENKAETNKQRYNINKFRTPKKSTMGNTSLDRYLLGAETPEPRGEKRTCSVVQSSAPFQRSTVQVQMSIDILSVALKSLPLLSKNEWFCIKRMDDVGWLCSNHQEIMAVNFTRLYEMILYSRLLNEHVIPSQPLTRPILIDQKILGDSAAWKILMRLSTERETATTWIISDRRVVANGMAIRLGVDSDDSGFVVYKVPANVNAFDLNDVKNFLLKVTQQGSTVESCRSEQAMTNLKTEAARLAAERSIEPDPTEVCELLDEWLSTDPENVCLHGEPVVWSHVLNASSSTGDDTET